MSENDSPESNPLMSAHRRDIDTQSETSIMTPEKVNEEVKSYIALLTRQQEEFTRDF